MPNRVPAFDVLEPRICLSAGGSPSLEPPHAVPNGSLIEATPAQSAASVLGGDFPSVTYPFVAYCAEGFSSGRINEFVPITNPNPFAVTYELWARYEVGVRDQLIESKSIPGLSRGGTTISDSQRGGAIGVRANEPYALVVKSTARLAVSFSHYDFGASIGETFTDTTSTSWSFAEGTVDHTHVNFEDFVLLYNPASTPVSVTIAVFQSGLPVRTFSRNVDAMRRGGWAMNDLGISDGAFSVSLTATSAVVAVLSHYQPSQYRGFGSLGAPGGGSTAGVVPKIDFDDHFYDLNGDAVASGIPRFQADSFISVFNPQSTATRVVLSLFGTKVQSIVKQVVLSVPSGTQQRFRVRDWGLPVDEYGLAFVASAPVVVAGSAFQGLGAVGLQAAQGPATVWDFGEGYMSRTRGGSAVLETLRVFNPQNDRINVHTTFYFADGGAPVTLDTAVGPQSEETIRIDQLASIRQRADQQWYGIRVTLSAAAIVMLEHWDSGNRGGFGTFGAPSGLTPALSPLMDSSVYDPPATLFADEFNTAGLVDESKWTTPTGDPAFFGRTSLRNWLTSSHQEQLTVNSAGYVSLPLDTFNPFDPNGSSLYGTEIDTRTKFSVGSGLGAEARVWIDPTLPAGAVASLFLYDFNDTTKRHDEIDAEMLSKYFATGGHLNTNVYSNEPLGAGHPGAVDIAGLSLTGGWNRVRVNWYSDRVEWLVNGNVVQVRRDVVPQGPMTVRLNIWAPASDWAEAYGPSLQPVRNLSLNTRFEYRVDYVRVYRLG